MNTSPDPVTTPVAPLALNFAEREAPEWVQLLPAGRSFEGVDGRKWSVEGDGTDLVAAFSALGRKLPIDIEHATQLRAPKGEDASAVGWIVEMEARETGLWGKVEWTEQGRWLIVNGSYRYLSPVFHYSPRTGIVSRMVSAGLTNNPNLDLVALNRAEGAEKENEEMDKTVLEALGLNQNATAAEAVAAIEKLKADKATALNRAETPDPERFVPKADHEIALNRLRQFKADAAERRKAEIEAAVDAEIEAGKIAPVSRDYHIAACQAEGGLERFKTAMNSAPVIAGDSGLDKKTPGGGAGDQLTAEQLALCTAWGITPEEFRKRAEKEA